MTIKGLKGKSLLILTIWVLAIQFNIHVWGNNSPVAVINGPYNGPVKEAIVFSSDGSEDSDGVIMAYLWSFGDGETSTEQNPSHVYSEEGVYTVSLTVRDNMGATGTGETYCMAYSIPNRHPIVCINGPYEGELNWCIPFNCDGTYDPDDDNMEYLWDFGDGSQSHLKNTIHSYTSTGTYTVTLTVTDQMGLSSTCTTNCTISKPPNIQPSATIFGVYSSTPGQAVYFTSYCSDQDGNIVSYKWDFGDGTTATEGRNTTHTYNTAGKYLITLTVTDNEGSICTANTTCTVQEENINQNYGDNNLLMIPGLAVIVIIFLIYRTFFSK